jgi:hypothetical protein
MFCYRDVYLQEMFCLGDVLLRRRCVYRRFVEETFFRGDILYMRQNYIYTVFCTHINLFEDRKMFGPV